MWQVDAHGHAKAVGLVRMMEGLDQDESTIHKVVKGPILIAILHKTLTNKQEQLENTRNRLGKSSPFKGVHGNEHIVDCDVGKEGSDSHQGRNPPAQASSSYPSSRNACCYADRMTDVLQTMQAYTGRLFCTHQRAYASTRSRQDAVVHMKARAPHMMF